MRLQIAILTVSDRVSRGDMDDAGGPAVAAALPEEYDVAARAVVPDERERIGETLQRWSSGGIDVIFTTGGTGLGPRDVTPEATAQVCDRLVPGIAEALRAAGLRSTQQSMLSRALAGISGQTLIINLPGSPGGAREGVEVVLPVLAHAISTLRGGSH